MAVVDECAAERFRGLIEVKAREVAATPTGLRGIGRNRGGA